MRDKWEQELNATVEAEYRRQRADFLLALQWWLRDVWLQTLGGVEGRGPWSVARGPAGAGTGGQEPSPPHSLLVFPQLAGTQQVARRLSPKAALENLRIIEELQRWLQTNVQEALALEVGLLKLHL